MMDKKIIKKNGAVVNFERRVLVNSLINAGASKDIAKAITLQIESEISDGDSTVLIYKKAFNMLHNKFKGVAMRYSLKRALFNLGPTGFPFEKFVAEIFSRKGYATVTNVHLKGICIEHEVDVFATGKERIAFEAKFHNDTHTRTDIKAILYVKSRFDDLMGVTLKNRIFSMSKKGIADRCILITNTKFSSSAIKYAKCAGVEIIGWGYPYKNNLQTMIKDVDAHPITCIPSLSKSKLKELTDFGIVTCKGLLEKKEILSSLSNSDEVEKEARMLCIPEKRF